ncbi:unnamed protein product [Ectocarpus sp. CCAP 1310/34]|nr:unnamed protein product [Ectocarpus sp. CCAP 1310/34]
MALTFGHSGPKSGLLVYMGDLICCSSTWKGHISLLDITFQALQAAVKSVAKRWGPKHDEAFAEVKRLLTNAPVLHFPDLSQEFVIHVDASEVGARAFLAQQNGDDVNILAYSSQRFNKSQQHYPATMKECYAVVLAI